MTAAATIINKVFNALGTGAICAWLDKRECTCTILNTKNPQEATWLIAMLAYQVAIRSGMTVKDTLKNISDAVRFIETAKPNMEDEP